MTAIAENRMSSLRAKIHIAKQQLGMNDDEYRAFLAGTTGKITSAQMNDAELRKVLDDFTRLGWRPTAPKSAISNPVASIPTASAPEGRWLSRPSNWDDPAKNAMYRKLYAMICANKAKGWNWGYVRGTAQKMFTATKGGTVVLEWLTGAELHGLVSTLQIHSNRLTGRKT